MVVSFNLGLIVVVGSRVYETSCWSDIILCTDLAGRNRNIWWNMGVIIIMGVWRMHVWYWGVCLICVESLGDLYSDRVYVSYGVSWYLSLQNLNLQ